MALNQEIIDIVLKALPDDVCIVPEKRMEITTEGGLDAVGNIDKLRHYVPILKSSGIAVSLFIDADNAQIEAARDCGCEIIEIHTGKYADTKSDEGLIRELDIIKKASKFAADLGLTVNAGHGLNYNNVYNISMIPEIDTLNIGHSIISQAIFTGLEKAVRDMISDS